MTSSLFLILAALLGLTVGSFLNVVILRGRRRKRPNGPPWARLAHLGGRSSCTSCRTALSIFELIPLISFALQKGRCRHCDIVLSWQYPIVEGGTAIVYMLLTWFVLSRFDPAPWSLLFLLLLFIGAAAAMVTFVADLHFQIIPHGAFLTLLVLGVIATILRAVYPTLFVGSFLYRGVWHDLVSGGALAGSLAALWFFSRGRWIGLGDANLMLALSLIAGFPTSLVAFLFSFWLGGITGASLLVLGRKRLTSKIPFGPFIIAGFTLAYFFTPSFLSISGLEQIL